MFALLQCKQHAQSRTAVCRAFVYFASMLESLGCCLGITALDCNVSHACWKIALRLIYSRTKVTCKSIGDGDIIRVFQIPVPAKVVSDSHLHAICLAVS